jgi:glycosyltransferase involved in cell wall biosynthesis
MKLSDKVLLGVGQSEIESPHILFVFRRKRRERLAIYQAGEGPNESFYGFTFFKQQHFSTSFIEGGSDNRNLLNWFWLPFEQRIARRIKMGFVFDLALTNVNKLRQADVIISTVDACGLPIAMLKYLGVLNTPLIYISQGLSDRIDLLAKGTWSRSTFQELYGRFLSAADRVIALGEGAAEHLTRTFQFRPNQVSCIPFGIDNRFWSPNPDLSHRDYILSVGSDRARDYITLLKAVAEERLKIVTRQSIPQSLMKETTEVDSKFTHIELRNLYRGARFVITPLKNVFQPSGQSATLQAMACGKPVILTRTRGLWDPKQMCHLENCYLVEPGDVDGLRAAIDYFLNRPDEVIRIGRNARKTVENSYNSHSFANELELLINEVIVR